MFGNLQIETVDFSEEYGETAAGVLSREIQRDSRRYSAEFEN